MSCGCKTKNDLSVKKVETKHKIVISKNFFVKILFFSLLVLISPVFLGIILLILFKAIVLNEDIDIVPLLRKILNEDYFRKKVEPEDDEDEELDEDDVIAVNVEDITNKYK